MKKSSRFSNSVQIKNRKASFQYELKEKTEAGIVLKGTEIKSIREGNASIQEAYCFLRNGNAYIKGMNVAPYSNASFENHDIVRERKLLLKKRELEKMKGKRNSEENSYDET